MKNKIIGILVATLLILTAVSLVKLTNIDKNLQAVENISKGNNDWQIDVKTGNNMGMIGGKLPNYFTNVTNDVNLIGIKGFRLSIGDFNGDVYPDIFIHLFQNDGAGQEDVLKKQLLYLNVPGDDPSDPYSRKYINYTAESGIWANRQGTDVGRHSDAAIFADVDNDGDLDIFTSVYVHRNYGFNQGTNDLLLNDGNAHFTLAPNSPFHNDPIYNTAGAVFLDYNNDGNIDLFIGNWYYPAYGILSYDRLYQGHGDGSFTDVTNSAGLNAATTCIYGVATFDWNNDGFMDLFAPTYGWSVSGSNPIHWRNNGDGTFTQVQDTTHYSDNRGYDGPRNPYTGQGMASFGTMPRDYDNDGDFDFFEVFVHGWGDGASGVHSTVVTNEDDVFYWDFERVDGRSSDDNNINHHGDHYVSWFDIDNDGLSDFIMTECGYSNDRLYLFKQGQDHNFDLFTSDAGLDSVNTANLPSHNVLPVDYDLDGDEDLLLGFASLVEGIQLWRNDIGNQNNWLTVTLEGAGIPGKSNKCAIGARVEVMAGGITYTREVSAGNGHQGPQVPLSLTFGLGQATQIDSIKVFWPNSEQTVTELNNIPVNQFLVINEIKEELVGNWSFDEGSGAIAFDSSGNGNDGTIYGAQWTVDTLSGEGYALDFDGVDDQVLVENDPSLDMENEVTVEAWIKPRSFQSPSTGLWNCVVSKDAGSGPTGEWTWILLAGYTDTEKGRLSFQIRGENGATGPQTDPIIPKDQWSHIVGVYDGSHLSMYLNGESVFTAPVSVGPLYNCNIPLEIGYDQDKPDSDYFAFDGMIDEVQVYNMALSADEILSHYNSRNKCIGFYHMDEGSGTTAYDSSGNGNHGTLTNMDINICWVDGILDSSALLFDGVDDCVEVDTLNIDQSATSNGVSMEAWVYPTSISSGRHQIISSDDGGYDWSILREGGNWHVFTGENSRNTGFSVDINKWQHIAAVFIPGIGVNFYKNGVKTSIPYISYDSSDNPICIADNPGSWQEFFTGRIDKVGIYSRALSEEEIIGHYNKIKECRGLWLINEGSGTITYDGSGNDNDGTIYGAQWTQETLDGEGYALDFDGVDDYVDCGNDVSLNPSNAITIEAWVYPRSFQTEWPYIRGIAQKSLYGMSSGYLLRFGDAGLANNKIQFMINNLKLNGNREHTVNCWYHIVATYDGTVMKLYSNGQLDSSTPYSGSIIPTNDLLIIGRDAGQGGNRNFDGKIDEVRLYNYALSEEEILNHFNSKYQYIGLWHMDEGSGTTAYDSSGNGNHGTLTNMDISTCWVQGVSNTALNFDGTNDYVDCGNNDMFNMGYDGVTLEAWIYKTTGGGYQGIGYDGIITIDRVPGKYSGYILALVALVDDKYEIEIAFGDGIGGGSLHRRSKISPPIIEPNTWYHVVGVINGPNNMSIYVNGEDVGGTYSGSATSVGWLGGPCVIGNKWAGDRYFKGKIDEVGIYKRALSADEVFSNYIRYQPPINPLPKIKEIL